MIKDVAMLNVSGAGMVGAPGSYAKVFDVLGKNNINVMMISAAASEGNISMVIRRAILGRAISTLEIALLDRSGLVSEVSAEDDVAVIAVMGANMKGTLGVASKIFAIVAKKGINIRMIAQGSSELNISFVVKEKDGAAVVKGNSRRIQPRQNIDHPGRLDLCLRIFLITFFEQVQVIYLALTLLIIQATDEQSQRLKPGCVLRTIQYSLLSS